MEPVKPGDVIVIRKETFRVVSVEVVTGYGEKGKYSYTAVMVENEKPHALGPALSL